MRLARLLLGRFLVAGLACGACTSGPVTESKWSLPRKAFYDAPFPNEDLRLADGHIDVSGFPNPDGIALVEQARAMLASDARGFGQASSLVFPFSDDLDPTTLPDLVGSAKPTSSVFLLSVDSSAPDFGQRRQVWATFQADGGPFGAPHVLTLVPVQGMPLRPGTLYVAGVRNTVKDSHGRAVGAPAMLRELVAGRRPPGLSDGTYTAYQTALAALPGASIPASEIAALTVFRTDTTETALSTVADAMRALPLPAPKTAFVRQEVFDNFCVYHSTIEMPVYQAGKSPFSTTGGGWTFDAEGKPILQSMEEANLVVTVPRLPMPQGGWPTVVFVRTGGGGDRPLVDRGPRATNGGPSIAPGTGPAMEFAKVGWAGIEVDGPLGGLRNPAGADEQFTVFNIFNANALRDNLRQSAAELALLARVVPTLSINAADCPGVASTVQLRGTDLALMGHSMGSFIAPLVAWLEPNYRAVILSGAGASWTENIVYKEKPVKVRPAAEVLLNFVSLDRTLTRGDPVFSLVQWAAEPADPAIYAPNLVTEPLHGQQPRHILMLQGIVDHYIMPNIANAVSLPLGLDLGDAPLDATIPELADQEHLADLLPFVARMPKTLPLSGNAAGGAATAVVVQHMGDAIEDGHEAAFQTEPPKVQYRCFLKSRLTGIPTVVPKTATDCGF